MTRPSPPPPTPGAGATRLTPSRPKPPEGLTDEVITKVVDHFYALARADAVVGPIFRRVVPDHEWQAHLDKIADFWSSMLLGTGRYHGRPMPKHFAIPELDDAHFRRWLALFRHTVETLCPPDVAALFIQRSETIGNSFRLTLKMRRGEDVLFLKPLTREPYPAAE